MKVRSTGEKREGSEKGRADSKVDRID